MLSICTYYTCIICTCHLHNLYSYLHICNLCITCSYTSFTSLICICITHTFIHSSTFPPAKPQQPGGACHHPPADKNIPPKRASATRISWWGGWSLAAPCVLRAGCHCLKDSCLDPSLVPLDWETSGAPHWDKSPCTRGPGLVCCITSHYFMLHYLAVVTAFCYCIALYCMVPHCVALYCNALYCAI